MKITITNKFHNTETRVIVHPDCDGYCTITPSQMKRARRALCGQACSCSGDLGNNGYQHDIAWHDLNDDGSILIRLRGY
jgi:hypothetical protein